MLPVANGLTNVWPRRWKPGGEENNQPVAELARHWLAATRLSDVSKALFYAGHAGDVALAAYAPLDAVHWYSQALELLSRRAPGNDRERCALMVGIGTAERQAGLSEHRETLREAGRLARELDDRGLLTSVALSRDPGMEIISEVDEDRLAVLQTALKAVGPSDSVDRARLLACLSEEIDQRDLVRRSSVAEEAIDVAHRLGDETTLLAVLILAIPPFARPDNLDRRLEETALALALSDQVRDVSVRFLALALRTIACGESGDFEAVDVCLAEMESIARRTGLPFQWWQVHSQLSCQLLLAGRTEHAQIHANETFSIGTKLGLSVAMVTYGAHQMRICLEQGRLAEVADLVAQALEETPTVPSLRVNVARIHCELGRHDEASALLNADLANDFNDFPFDAAWLYALTVYADCAADMGHSDAAQVLYDKLVPYRQRFVYVTVSDGGAVDRPLGRLSTLLGRYDDAQEQLNQALEMHERIHAPYWIARTRLDLAELSVNRSNWTDTEIAHDLIQDVQRIAHDFGYEGLFPRMEHLLTRLD